MFDTDEEDGNYEDFMVSDDESLQMEFESDVEEHEKQQEGDSRDSVTPNGNDAAITKMVSEGEKLMNIGKWDNARLQFLKILNRIYPSPSGLPSLDIFPIWVKIMNCWSRILYYNNCNNLLNLNDLFGQCSQFCDYLLQENDNSHIRLSQLQYLIVDFFPDLSNRYIFETNEIDDCESRQILDKVNIQLNLYTIFKTLRTVDHRIADFLELQSIILSQWKRLLSIPTMGPRNNNDLSSSLSIDYHSFNTIITNLLNIFNKDDCSAIIANKSPFEQRIITKRFEVTFQIFILSYLFNNNRTMRNDTVMILKLDQILELFQECSRSLLTISQDSRLMFLYHFSYSIQLLTDIVVDMNPYKTVSSCRDHFLSSLQYLEILGSYSQWIENGYCQYLLSGFILTSIFIILQDKYYNNSQSQEDRFLDPFEYEQIKIIGKNLQYRHIIKMLQQFYTKLAKMANLEETYYEIQGILRNLNINEAVYKYEVLLEEMFNIVIKLKLLYKIVPLYERISIIDLQKLLTYDPINHQLNKDDIIKLLMKFKLYDEPERGEREGRRRRRISFSIDFVEDHVLFGDDLSSTRNVFVDNDVGTCEKNRDIEIFFKSINEPANDNDISNNMITKRYSGKEDNISYNSQVNSSGNTQKVEGLAQFQLQAALLISESLSTMTTTVSSSSSSPTSSSNMV